MSKVEMSIVVPVYNSTKYLDRCINSVLSQTLREVELILVDDGSTDNSGDLCDSWALADDRVRVIHQHNRGVSAARNRGLVESVGDYIMFLDSDDALSVNTCAQVLEYAETNAADCVIFGFLQETGTVWAPEFERVYPNLDAFKADFVAWLNTELLSSSVNKLYRRECIVTMFPEDMSFGEDLVFSLNYIKQCRRICFVPWPLYLHNNVNECSLTHTPSSDKLTDIERWQYAVVQFGGQDAVSANLYDKYFKDIMLCLRRFYASNQLDDKDKKSFLHLWYQQSYLKSQKPSSCVGMV